MRATALFCAVLLSTRIGMSCAVPSCSPCACFAASVSSTLWLRSRFPLRSRSASFFVSPEIESESLSTSESSCAASYLAFAARTRDGWRPHRNSKRAAWSTDAPPIACSRMSISAWASGTTMNLARYAYHSLVRREPSLSSSRVMSAGSVSP